MSEASRGSDKPSRGNPRDAQQTSVDSASAESRSAESREANAPGSGPDRSKSASAKWEYVVRCGSMRILSVMTARQSFRYGDEVVVRGDRGAELGVVLCEATPAAVEGLSEPVGGKILRLVTPDDRAQVDHLSGMVREDLKTCQKCVDHLGLKMNLVDVERLFGGERIIVYYLADGRVDFRQLVRDLAREFQTRIEMRQIGVRDEAKLLADYGDCGQPICCANFLSKMPPVSMRMAKLQKSTLDPTKISGRCGRLKCCLRYEFDTYEELSSQLPPVGSKILTREGAATVLAQDILSQQLMIKTEDKRRVLIEVGDVVKITHRAADPDESPRKKTKNRRQP